jgi:hypothetical protein
MQFIERALHKAILAALDTSDTSSILREESIREESRMLPRVRQARTGMELKKRHFQLAPERWPLLMKEKHMLRRGFADATVIRVNGNNDSEYCPCARAVA